MPARLGRHFIPSQFWNLQALQLAQQQVLVRVPSHKQDAGTAFFPVPITDAAGQLYFAA